MRYPFALCVLCTLACAAMAETPFDVAAIEEYVSGHVKTNGFVGISIAIARDGKLVLAKAYGKRSLNDAEDATTKTLFAAGSVTKQFTCACILLLAEEGKLSIHDKVAKYYPALTRAKDITLYDLMTHVSGYPDYYPLDFVDRRMRKAIAPDKLIEEYAGGKLDFEPCTRWSYSNTGYVILGRVVEKISGETFAEFLQKRIFKPLAMEDSSFEPKPNAKNRATGHSAFALDDAETAVTEAEGWLHAAGGIFTTPADLAKWDLALMQGKLLKADSHATMIAPRKLSDGRLKNYGCGLSIAQREGETIVQHSGAVSGYLAFNTMVPGTKSAVILMTNCDHRDAAALHGELLTRLLKADAGKGSTLPKIDGPMPKEVALELLHQLQAGEVKREALGDEYSRYLTPERVQRCKDRLKELGEPEKVLVESTSERGGMEVAVIRFIFKETKIKALLYRSPDGKIQEFLLFKS